MATHVLPVLSDPTLLADIRQYGTFDTAGCYQCGTCTVSCELVSDSATFPRKSIRYALLGLRAPLLASLDPWICEDCGDCSIACPRQAEPRISMVTLRRFLSAQYDWTGLAPRLLRSKAWYLGSLIGAAVLTLLLILGYHLWYVKMAVSDFVTMPLGLEHTFPLMTYYTLTVILVPLLLLLSRVFRIWRLTMNGTRRPKVPLSAYVLEAWVYVYQSVTTSLMHKCPEHRRWVGHCMMAGGTITMLAIKVFGLHWFQTDNIYPIYNPQRWVGYLAAGLVLYGLGDILIGRLLARREIYKETKFQDWVFPVLLLLTVASGLTVHIFRYVGFGLTCHFAYAVHVIIATPMLVVEMAFGKWAHMIYRPLALYFQAVRERVARQTPAQEGVYAF